MDLDDILDEIQKLPDFSHEELEHEQPLISLKKNHSVFSVERNYINSKEYHDKFEKLPVGKETQQSLYVQAGRLLEFVDNLSEEEMEQERLLAINCRTGEFIVDNFDRKGEVYKTSFNDAEIKCINKCKDSIALIHNHSHNGRPSGQDILAYLKNDKVKLSLIACHNGEVYGIYAVRQSFEEVYLEALEEQKKKTSNIEEAKRLATTEMYLLNDRLSDRHKFFFIEKL